MAAEGSIIVKFYDQEIFVSNTQYNLLKALNKNAKLTRDELIEKIKCPRSTTYFNLESLIKRGFANKLDVHADGKTGRPWVYFYLTSKGKELIKKIEADLNEF